MSSSFGPRLLAEMGSSAAMCPTVPYGMRASSIKKSLAGSSVPNACGCFQGGWCQSHHGPIRCAGRQHSQDLQDVQTCGNNAMPALQWCHATPTTQRHAADCAQRSRMTRHDVPHATNDIIYPLLAIKP
jgi:hypothetical protein